MEKIIKKIKDGLVYINSNESAAAGELKYIIKLVNVADNITISNTDTANTIVQLKDFKKVLDILEDTKISGLIKKEKIEILKDKMKLSISYDFRDMNTNYMDKAKKITIKSGDIKKMIQLKKDISSNGELKYISITEHGVAATDSYRLGILKSDVKVEKLYLIPDAVIELIEAEKQVELYKDEYDRYKIEFRGITIKWNNFNNNFPNFKEILKQAEKLPHQIIFDKKEFENNLKKLNKISMECSEKYRTNFKLDNNTIVSAFNKTMDIEQEIKTLNHVSAPINISFKGDYLMDYLKRVDVEKLVINYNHSSSMISMEHGEYKYLLMPMVWSDKNDR